LADDEAQGETESTANGCGYGSVYLVGLLAIGMILGVSFGGVALEGPDRGNRGANLTRALVGGVGCLLVVSSVIVCAIHKLRPRVQSGSEQIIQFGTVFLPLLVGLIASMACLGLLCI
jgi:hypothetical protein